MKFICFLDCKYTNPKINQTIYFFQIGFSIIKGTTTPRTKLDIIKLKSLLLNFRSVCAINANIKTAFEVSSSYSFEELVIKNTPAAEQLVVSFK